MSDTVRDLQLPFSQDDAWGLELGAMVTVSGLVFTGRSRFHIRAIEENAAYTSRGHLDILRELSGYSIEEAIFCGGSSKGFLWPQITADVLGLPMKIPEVKEVVAAE